MTARDADQDHHAFGWREQRDPNAFSDTSVYPAANPDVHPLGHWHGARRRRDRRI